jgi:hypothetical protein
MGEARGTGLKEVNSTISPDSKSSPLKRGEFESLLELSLHLVVAEEIPRKCRTEKNLWKEFSDSWKFNSSEILQLEDFNVNGMN